MILCRKALQLAPDKARILTNLCSNSEIIWYETCVPRGSPLIMNPQKFFMRLLATAIVLFAAQHSLFATLVYRYELAYQGQIRPPGGIPAT